ncbi:hypothetical protein B566_EDAN000796 [Ephemera danica]|nr:hypothetical protein B566_EDAN000796 [Ephemera danica]
MTDNKSRIYLGNLHANVSEKDIKKRLKEFGVATEINIKRREDHEGNVTATFAHITLLVDNVNKCVDQLNQQKWNGQSIRAEVAKTSYLERMAAKRISTQNLPYQTKAHEIPKERMTTKRTSTQSLPTQSKPPEVAKAAKKAKRNSEPEDKKQSKKHFSDSDDSDSEVYWQKDFDSQKAVTIESSEHTTKDTKKGTDLLSRFESYSSVWNDSPALGTSYNYDFSLTASEKSKSFDAKQDQHEKSGKFNSSPRKAEHNNDTRKKKKEKQLPNGLKSSANNVINGHKEEKSKGKIGDKKVANKQQSEKKRLQSMQERLAALESQKESVRNALAGQLPNKKIKFDDADDTVETQKSKQLFADESDEEEEDQGDFAIRQRFEGRKGEKLLELQSRFATDKRFRLDERFAESDSEEEQQQQPPEEKNDEDDETAKQIMKMVVRFDPSKPEHGEKYTRVSEPPTKKRKKKKDEDDDDDNEEMGKLAATETPMPEVSGERFYEVSKSLTTALAPSSSNTFSLRALFHQQDGSESGDEEEQQEEETPRVQKKLIKNPLLQEDESDVEGDESVPLSSETEEGAAFFQAATIDSASQFVQQRRELLSEVKKKLRKVVKNKFAFKRKLGGRSTTKQKHKPDMN